MTAEDERAIGRVLYDYCDFVDANRPDDVVALFTPDAVFDFGFGRTFTGPAELRQLFGGLGRYSATSHHLTNVVIDVAGDRAGARSRVLAVHLMADDGAPLVLGGRYEDELARVGERWALARRTLRAAVEFDAADLTRPAAGAAPRWGPIPRGA
jgi:ketosteroid isomerase-like protein